MRVLAVADVGGSLEHHVLEEVGEARAALALIARADVVVDRNGKDGRRMILGDDHAEAVLQLGVGELDLLDGGGGESEHAHEPEGREPAK